MAVSANNDRIRSQGQYKILTMGELLALVMLVLLTYFSFVVTSQGHSYSVITIILFAAIVISAFAVLASGFMENARILSRSLIVFFLATILACTNIMFFEGLQSFVLILLIFIGLYGIFQEIFEIKAYEESVSKGRLRVIDNTAKASEDDDSEGIHPVAELLQVKAELPKKKSRKPSGSKKSSSARGTSPKGKTSSSSRSKSSKKTPAVKKAPAKKKTAVKKSAAKKAGKKKPASKRKR